MLPSEMSDSIPKSVLRYVWSIKVLKAGLGMTDENQVRQWFHENPDALNEFKRMTRRLESGIQGLQEDCIRGLSEIRAVRSVRGGNVNMIEE